jgi:hypothetical protein
MVVIDCWNTQVHRDHFMIREPVSAGHTSRWYDSGIPRPQDRKSL